MPLHFSSQKMTDQGLALAWYLRGVGDTSGLVSAWHVPGAGDGSGVGVGMVSTPAAGGGSGVGIGIVSTRG